MEELFCDCGSRAFFGACCAPYLLGEEAPPTAEALMRSRYTAYVRRDEGYLLRSWHPKTRPARLELEPVSWLGLRVHSTEGGQPGDLQGVVEFSAEYRAAGRILRLSERSRFVREGGRWLYLDGAEPPKANKNAPCPCGSGKKYKRCCGSER